MSRRARVGALLVVVASCGAITWNCAHRPSTAPGHSSGQLESGGRTRTFIWFRPSGPGPFPLVIALHGRLGSGAQMLELTNFTALAQREGFIVVYPDGVGRSWADGRGTSPASKAGIDDVAFLSALIDDFVRREQADANRVAIVGMSNGGFMALSMACQAADKVAAVGSVTGFMGEALARGCAPSRPVSVAVIAGEADPVVPFGGGALEGGRGVVVGAVQTYEVFRRLDGCRGGSVVRALPDVAPDDGTTVTRTESDACARASAVRLDVVHGGGHTWPSGDRYLPERLIGKTSRDLDASAELWRFFKTAFR